ncbi:MAG: hypothetical protein PVF68_16855 [Acidobacteriota bacterium]|jgi:hypothetical protein
MTQEKPSSEVIRTLAGYAGDAPVVSIYLPVQRHPTQTRQNQIRLKNLCREAEDRLAAVGIPEADAGGMLEPATGAMSGEHPLRPGERGRGLFLGPGGMSQVALPIEARELVVAAERYHLKPLFAALPHMQAFHVLALSRNEIALFRGDGTRLRRIQLDPDAPTSLEDVAGHQLTEPRLQYHAGDRGSQAAIFHGHGAGKDDRDAELSGFLRRTDEVLGEHAERGIPVVLAGVENLQAEFRRLSSCPDLLAEDVPGNVEHLSVDALHEQAWPLVSAHLAEHREGLLRELDDTPPGRRCDRMADVLTASVDGRVDRLFVAADREVWGRYREDERRADVHDERRPGDTDLLDRSAVATFLTGGTVYPVPRDEIPGGRLALAALRAG